MAAMKISFLIILFACHQTQSTNNTDPFRPWGDESDGGTSTTTEDVSLRSESVTEINKKMEKRDIEVNIGLNSTSNKEASTTKEFEIERVTKGSEIISTTQKSTRGKNENKISTHKPTTIDITEQKNKQTNAKNEPKVTKEAQKHPNLKENEPTSSKSTPHPTIRIRLSQGRQANEGPCDPKNGEELEESTPKSQGTRPTQKPKENIQAAASNISPVVKNTTEKVASTTENNGRNTTAKPLVVTDQYNTIQPSNNSTNSTSSSKPASTKKNEKWKKLLKLMGPAIGIFTLLGGMLYMITSITV